MTDDGITPDRLRRAGWDDNEHGQFHYPDIPKNRLWVVCVRSRRRGDEWHWMRPTPGDGWMHPAASLLTGMADVLARLKAAGGGAA